jgi:hypothetical protein
MGSRIPLQRSMVVSDGGLVYPAVGVIPCSYIRQVATIRRDLPPERWSPQGYPMNILSLFCGQIMVK